MKKVLSILLLLIFLYNLTGYYVVFRVLQYRVRREIKYRIKQNISDDELVLISISITDDKCLTWTKPNKEFRYKEEMYDIVRQETKEDMILYYCVHDFKESKLFSDLDGHVQRHIADNPKQRKKAENLLKKVTKDYFFQVLIINNSHRASQNLKYKKYLQAYNSICLDVITPPPKLV